METDTLLDERLFAVYVFVFPMYGTRSSERLQLQNRVTVVQDFIFDTIREKQMKNASDYTLWAKVQYKPRELIL